MLSVMIVAVLAVLAAAGVLVLVARQAPGHEGAAGFWQDLREGIAARRHPDADQVAAARVAQVEPVDVSLGELLRANVEPGSGYVQVDQIAEPLAKVVDRAAEPIAKVVDRAAEPLAKVVDRASEPIAKAVDRATERVRPGRDTAD